jgi:hypothetical protein
MPGCSSIHSGFTILYRRFLTSPSGSPTSVRLTTDVTNSNYSYLPYTAHPECLGGEACFSLPHGPAHLEICLGRLSNTDLSFRFGLSNARAGDTHGPTATFPKLPMRKNLVGGLLSAKYG